LVVGGGEALDFVLGDNELVHGCFVLLLQLDELCVVV
jgi:hypothetical protein